MPSVLDLSGKSEALRGVTLILGEGLCSNIYILGRKRAMVIDAGVGNFANPVWPQLEGFGLQERALEAVVLTHAHHDHAGGVFIILERVKPRVYVHRLELGGIASSLGSKLVPVEDGNIVETELWPLKVIWTPGHTQGSICLYVEDEGILFSGDTVFPGGYYGRYDGETGSFEKLSESLRKLQELDVKVMLPGHGNPVYRGARIHIQRAYLNALGDA